MSQNVPIALGVSTVKRLLTIPVGAFGVYMLAEPWPSDHPAVIAGWAILTGYMMFCWSSSFHEAAHQTLWPWKWLSIWHGRLIGMFIVVPYNVYRESHIRHHAYLNRPDDWELWPYSDPTASRTFRRVFAWFDIVLGTFLGPIIYGRIFFSAKSPIKSASLRRTIWFEYLLSVAFWSATIGAVWLVWGAEVWKLLRILLLPLMVAGTIQTFRKFTEHLGMSSYDPILGTRTVMAGGWMTRLSSFLNFEIFVHGPHHRHPRVQHQELTTRMEEYIDGNPSVEFPVYSSYWQAMRAMLPSLLHDPGCGMNAGAAPPKKSKVDDIDRFVGDVVDEVLGSDQGSVQRPGKSGPDTPRDSLPANIENDDSSAMAESVGTSD